MYHVYIYICICITGKRKEEREAWRDGGERRGGKPKQGRKKISNKNADLQARSRHQLQLSMANLEDPQVGQCSVADSFEERSTTKTRIRRLVCRYRIYI